MIVLILMVVTAAGMENFVTDPAKDQLTNFKLKTDGPVGVITTSTGAPVSYSEASSTLNTKLNNNEFFMDSMTHINRARIPERTVHTKGTGAFGYFIVTGDITHICKAKFLSKVGKKTPVAVRFSTGVGERGVSELNLSSRGFAIKFYTEEGNFDIPGLNTPMSFCGDPIHFATFVHSARRNPATNLFDPNTLWDTLTSIPESLPSFMLLWANHGIPASYRKMPGYGIHTYQVKNKQGKSCFVKFHFVPIAGIENLTRDEACKIPDPDYLTRDLYNGIEIGDFPSWTVSVQIVTVADVKKAGYKVFDITRTISLKEFPLHEIGKLVLNRNPKNHFAEIEQMAFCPSNLVPGIVGAPDKVYESRRLAYKDAQFYRLGKNFERIAVNCPLQVNTFTTNRDGVPPLGDNEKDIPNYYPNSFNGPVPYMSEWTPGLIEIIENKTDNFDQAKELYANELTSEERLHLIENIVSLLQQVTYLPIRERAIKIFTKINLDLGFRVSQGLAKEEEEESRRLIG